MLQIKILINILLFYKDFKECKFWQSGHEGKWISTPFYGGRSAVALLLQLMVLLSGGSWDKFAMGAKFINLAVGSARQFYRMQLQYRVCKNNSKCSCMQFFYFAPYKNYKILFQTKLGCSGKGIYEAHGVESLLVCLSLRQTN